MLSADQIIAELALLPHPEGGWYRQTWMGTEQPRASGTAIYFLLKAGERSHWHRVDAVEIWHFHAGAPLRLSMAERATGPVQKAVLGADLQKCQRPQIIVPKDWWQSAQTLGDWTLVGCTVSPGFRFSGFDLAPPGFDIPDAP
jgi:uncharacterized protein